MKKVQIDRAFVKVKAYSGPAAVVENALRPKKLRGKRQTSPLKLIAENLIAGLGA